MIEIMEEEKTSGLVTPFPSAGGKDRHVLLTVRKKETCREKEKDSQLE